MNWKNIRIEYNLFINLTSVKVREIVKVSDKTRFNFPKLKMFWKKGLIMKIII